MKGRGAVALALVALTSGAAGCLAPRDGQRPAGADAAAAIRPGDAWVLRTNEPTPWGPRVRRERWVATAVGGDVVEFRVERAAGATGSDWVPAPSATVSRAGLAHRATAEGARLVRVRVPAGRYPCARRTRSRTEREGRVVQVDEWWAPGVPVPVQRWSRWNAHAQGPLRDPPRREADQALGTAWTVLERAPRR